MTSIEIELTDEQLEKVEILKSKGIDIGQAIDLLFDVKTEALSQIEDMDTDEGFISKIKDTALDTETKSEILRKHFEENKTYDRIVQDAKHGTKWSDFLSM